MVINEMMASNVFTILDEDNDSSDWIELFNAGDLPVNLEGFHLTDSPNDLFRWELPAYTLESGSFLLVFASGKDRAHSVPFHTNFTISAAGESIYLTDSNGLILDHFPATELPGDHSIGRDGDGSGGIIQFSQTTPGATNEGGMPHIPLLGVLELSHPSGRYTSGFDLSITASESSHTIRYTTDGSDPTAISAIYEGMIDIENRTAEPNGISMVPTNPPYTYETLG